MIPVMDRHDDYVVKLELSRVKIEYVGRLLREMQFLGSDFRQEGHAVEMDLSVTRGDDVTERMHEWLTEDGEIRDIQPWEVEEGSTTEKEIR